MKKYKDKIKSSYFIVNKVYLFVIFLLLTISDLTLAFAYFIASLFIFLWKSLTYKLPMDVKVDIPFETYVYKVTDKRELKLDLYYPPTKIGHSRPLIYFCHGGGWISGFRNQSNNVSWCKFLASRGFIVSSIDYRYGYKNSMDDILRDFTDGLEYLKKHSKKLHIDKDNIVLMGLSAGGHLSLLYAAYNALLDNSEKIQGIKAVVAYYAPSNLKDIFSSDTKSLFAKFGASQTLNGRPTDIEEIYDYYSPINWISERMLPTLLVHGKLDEVIPFSSTVELFKRLKKHNIPSELYVHKTAGHSFDTRLKDLTTINILEKTLRYLKKSVKGG
ncbi:MAG: alpha/beta hydrolase family protein [Tissierellaceae bacterium]|jgi:acetyl esterase/lipase|nr:alpha/beta hydrolase [Tissierellia bacterium]